MSNLVLFRLRNDASIYLADLDAGTVERTDPSAVETEHADILSAIETDGDGEMPYVKGIDFAFAASARSTSASHQMFPTR